MKFNQEFSFMLFITIKYPPSLFKGFNRVIKSLATIHAISIKVSSNFSKGLSFLPQY